jgi:class I fructose-bisphosphate aldolase
MACILWCYLRNPKFKTPEGDMHASADLTSQANHLGVTIQADIIKQKLPERNGGYKAVEQAYDMGAAAIGATIYFGSDDSHRELIEIAQAFALAHELGMGTILWCYTRNKAFKKDKDYHVSADLTGQANHLGVTIEADIIKQKLAENNGGYLALNNDGVTFGKYDKRMYTDLISDHPIDLCRYQVANCYMGRIGLINSGGASGENDFAEAAATAVINKRAGGTGLISGRKAFQRPMAEGVRLLNTIQDVYLDTSITIA